MMVVRFDQRVDGDCPVVLVTCTPLWRPCHDHRSLPSVPFALRTTHCIRVSDKSCSTLHFVTTHKCHQLHSRHSNPKLSGQADMALVSCLKTETVDACFAHEVQETVLY